MCACVVGFVVDIVLSMDSHPNLSVFSLDPDAFSKSSIVLLDIFPQPYKVNLLKNYFQYKIYSFLKKIKKVIIFQIKITC